MACRPPACVGSGASDAGRRAVHPQEGFQTTRREIVAVSELVRPATVFMLDAPCSEEKLREIESNPDALVVRVVSRDEPDRDGEGRAPGSPASSVDSAVVAAAEFKPKRNALKFPKNSAWSATCHCNYPPRLNAAAMITCRLQKSSQWCVARPRAVASRAPA